MKEVDSIIKLIRSILKITTRHTKEVTEIIVLALFLALMFEARQEVSTEIKTVNQAQDTELPEQYVRLHSISYEDEEEEIRNEIMYGEIEMLAQLIQAEAGTEDELGKRYVADVVLNRVDSPLFPDKIEAVIFQKNPVQFSCTANSGFSEAAWTVTEECFRVALEEYSEHRVNDQILYFRTDRYGSGTPAFKHGRHYFSTQ